MIAHCPGCGKFARARAKFGFDGIQTQEWIHTSCKRCGDHTVTVAVGMED